MASEIDGRRGLDESGRELTVLGGGPGELNDFSYEILQDRSYAVSYQFIRTIPLRP